MSRRANKRQRRRVADGPRNLTDPTVRRQPSAQPPFNPEAFFRKVAQTQTIAQKAKGVPGALRCVAKPQRAKHFDWHKPSLHVPELQWQSATGETRYSFERKHTPPHQLEMFKRLQFRYQVDGPPALGSEELWARVMEARSRRSILPNGLPGEDLGPELHAEINRLSIREYSDDGQWSFMVQAVRMAGEVADRLDVKHRDYRTVADWTLLVRFRSWVLQDDRNAFMILPLQDIHAEGWEHSYENDTPNNLQWISPRGDPGRHDLVEPEPEGGDA